MNAALQSLMYFTMSGAVLIGLVFFLINFLLGGIMMPFLKVKASRGKKLLVRVINPIHDYFRIGEIDEGFLVFKDRKKNTRRIYMQPGCVYRAATIHWVEIDDEKNCIYDRKGNQVSGFDAVKFDDLLKRALYKPAILGDNMMKIMLILLVFSLVLIAGVGILVFRMNGSVTTILNTVHSMTVTAVNGTGVIA